MRHPMNGDDFFDLWHEDGDQAFAILQDAFDVPLSCEVFQHGLEVARRRMRAPIAVQNYAHFLAAYYEPSPS